MDVLASRERREPRGRDERVRPARALGGVGRDTSAARLSFFGAHGTTKKADIRAGINGVVGAEEGEEARERVRSAGNVVLDERGDGRERGNYLVLWVSFFALFFSFGLTPCVGKSRKKEKKKKEKKKRNQEPRKKGPEPRTKKKEKERKQKRKKRKRKKKKRKKGEWGPRVYADAWFFRKVTLLSLSGGYDSALVFCPVPDPDKSSAGYRYCVAWATYTALYACATDMNIEAVILPWMHKDYTDDVTMMIRDGTLPDQSRVPPLDTQFSKVIITRPSAAVGFSLGSGQLVIHSMGILGLRPSESVSTCNVPSDHALVDPAGLEFIKKNNPGGAGYLSKALYKFAGISSFPDHVRREIRNPCDAVYHEHGRRHVIHVVGPDFRQQRGIMWHDAVAELTRAYVNVLKVAEKSLPSEVRVVRIPLISGGVFAGKFNEHGRTCVPELTARAVVAAMSEVASSLRGPLLKEYWLCTFTEPKETDLYRRAYDFARSVRHYDYKKKTFPSTASPKRIAASGDAHPYGTVGYAVQLGSSLGPRHKIGVMVAANSGRPGGSIGKSLEEIPTIEHDDVKRGFNGDLKTQEESVVSEWLYGECKGDRECGERLFRSTICGLWGQRARQVTQTIQNVEYTSAEAAAYGEAWVVRDAKLQSRGHDNTVTATLVFVAGPNANAKLGRIPPTDPEHYGSMYYTTNRKAAGKYDEFKKGVEASVRAGLLAMQAEGVTHALVAYVSGGIYAGEYRAQIRKEFKSLVSDVASAIGYDATIVIVDRS